MRQKENLKENKMEEKVEEAISKKDVIVIGGPTASGKTGLSIELAKRINGQIVYANI